MARKKTHVPLDVLFNGRLVGRLEKAPNFGISFHYDIDCWHGSIALRFLCSCR